MVDLNIKLPENFLDEEVRCGYTVSHEMKEVWAVEIDILVKILDVCKKYDIKICSFAGTTLGAIRHKGIIPWDDDIDLCLDRDNYIKLCNVSNKEFQYPYFFQTEYTDPGSLRGHIQVRRSDTTGILRNEYVQNKKFNQGIFIDIFPLDNIPDNKDEALKFRREIWKLKKKAYKMSLPLKEYIKSSSYIKSLIKLAYYPIMKLISKPPQYYYNKMENICTQYNKLECMRVAPISFSPLEERWTIYKRDIANLEEHVFEFVTIPSPKNYDIILKQEYGDYMQFVIGNSVHGDVIFDTSKSYKEYLQAR